MKTKVGWEMPPRKKARLESQAASTPSVSTPAAEEKLAEDIPPELDPDLWTDEQEIALFKGMIKWKPVGVSSCASMAPTVICDLY